MLPLKIYLKQGVQQFIFKGADLMWPGIRQLIHTKGFGEFAQDDVVVIYAWNGRVAKGDVENVKQDYDDEEDDDEKEEGADAKDETTG